MNFHALSFIEMLYYGTKKTALVRERLLYFACIYVANNFSSLRCAYPRFV